MRVLTGFGWKDQKVTKIPLEILKAEFGNQVYEKNITPITQAPNQIAV